MSINHKIQQISQNSEVFNKVSDFVFASFLSNLRRMLTLKLAWISSTFGNQICPVGQEYYKTFQFQGPVLKIGCPKHRFFYFVDFPEPNFFLELNLRQIGVTKWALINQIPNLLIIVYAKASIIMLSFPLFALIFQSVKLINEGIPNQFCLSLPFANGVGFDFIHTFLAV